jgi:hypothetical protein
MEVRGDPFRSPRLPHAGPSGVRRVIADDAKPARNLERSDFGVDDSDPCRPRQLPLETRVCCRDARYRDERSSEEDKPQISQDLLILMRFFAVM